MPFVFSAFSDRQIRGKLYSSNLRTAIATRRQKQPNGNWRKEKKKRLHMHPSCCRMKQAIKAKQEPNVMLRRLRRRQSTENGSRREESICKKINSYKKKEQQKSEHEHKLFRTKSGSRGSKTVVIHRCGSNKNK